MDLVKTTLPEEIKEQALKVSKEKQAEVLKVLTDIFNGTSDWEKQVDKIKIKDVNDSMSISLAETARKNAKDARLNAEKIFDAKRSEVQLKMSDYKLEDALWLKSKQIMQLKFKHIEEKAKFKSEFVKRYEIEQKELKTELRIEKIIKFKPEIEKSEIENLSDEIFETVLSGLEKEYNDKIEAEKKAEEKRIEKERIEKLHNKRKDSVLHLWHYTDFNLENKNLGEYADGAWNSLVNQLEKADKKEKEKQEQIRKENERLKKEAEEKELRNNKRNDELRPYIIFIRDYNNLLNKEENEYQKEFTDIKKGAELQWEYDRKEMKKKAEQEAKLREQKLKLEAQIKAKKEAEEKAKEAELLRVQNELNKGDQDKVNDLKKDLSMLKTKYIFESQKNNKMYSDVGILIDKVINHIK